MRLNAVLVVVVLQATLRWQTPTAELQGPLTMGLLQDQEDDEIRQLQADRNSAETSTETSSQEKDEEDDSKAPKFIHERIKPEDNHIGPDWIRAPGFKTIPGAVLERVWSERQLRQILQEDIDAFETIKAAKPAAKDEAKMTAEEVTAERLYAKAMDLYAKPLPEKLEALTFFKQAASLGHVAARTFIATENLYGQYGELNLEFAAKEFDELVKTGGSEAHMALAMLHLVGVGGKNVSQPTALVHLHWSAMSNNFYAQMALGYRYWYGINVQMDCERALSYYRRVARLVAAKSKFPGSPTIHRVRIMDEYENPGNQETEIVDYYQLLADKGDVPAQVGLGQLYYQGGKTIPQDHRKAFEYFTLAANSGNAIAYAYLGKLYLESSATINANYETAFKYFKKAADLGDPVGQSGLGLMYLKGLSVPVDTLKALNYFTQAADQGWVDGQLHLGNMYFTGTGVKADFKLAFKYFNLATQSGHVVAYYNLGLMHAYGLGLMRSCPAAVEFFKNVAERGLWGSKMMQAHNNYKKKKMDAAFMQYALLAEMGYESAQSNVAFLLHHNYVTLFEDRREDLIRAFYYWKRAAAQGSSAAQVKLGDYYYYGWGTDVDYETAATLYRKASDQQYNAQAMFNLGYMHEQGLGMKRDWHLAKRFYDLAAETNADAKVPVAMALLKLQILAKIDTLRESPYKFIFYLDENFAANWDLYMITFLTLLLGVVMYTRRPYQQPAAQQAPVQEQEVPLLNAAEEAPPTSATEEPEPEPAATPAPENTANRTPEETNAAEPPAASRSSTADPTE